MGVWSVRVTLGHHAASQRGKHAGFSWIQKSSKTRASMGGILASMIPRSQARPKPLWEAYWLQTCLQVKQDPGLTKAGASGSNLKQTHHDACNIVLFALYLLEVASSWLVEEQLFSCKRRLRCPSLMPAHVIAGWRV